MVRCGIVYVIALLATLAAAPAAGQDAGARSDRADSYLARRVVHAFDFEERDENNYERLPRYWYTVGGPGFPRHTADETAFDTARAVSGKHAFRLRSNGGSAAAVVEHGAIAAVPGADYIVTAKLQTAKMRNSRARLVTYFVDQHGRRIEKSTQRTGLTQSEGKWERLELRLDGEHPEAAWIILRIELLQADEFRRATLGKHEVFKQDIGATAWFDDIVVFQLPRVQINTQTPINVVRAPDQPRLDITVSDQTGEQLTAVVQVYDHLGQTVDRQRRIFAGRQAPTWQWAPKFERFGWYWADLTVSGERGVVGRRAVAFVYLPRAKQIDRDEADRFGIIAEDMTEAERQLLRPMLERIHANAVIIDIWRGDQTVTLTSDDSMPDDPIVNGLLTDGRSVTLSIAETPRILAETANTDVHLPIAVLSSDPANWEAHLQPLAVTYAQPIQRWQVGRVGSDEAYWRRDLAPSMRSIQSWLKGIVPNAVVAVPWSVQHELSDKARAIRDLTVTIPTSVRPNLIVPHIEALDAGDRRLSLAVERLGTDQFAHDERAADFAMRLIEAARADVGPVYVRYLWNQGESRRQITATPDPMLAVLANTIDRLADRRFVGRTQLSEGVHAYILDGQAGGALIAWNESSPHADVPIDLYLGDQPVAIDIWGNAQTLGRADGKHALTVGKMPVVIEGIDARLARFRSMLRFDPGFVESSYKVHQLDLVIANPFNRTITGKVRLDAIEKWAINPRLMPFSIAAGKEIRIPMELTFPISELAGEKRLAAQIEIDADQQYKLDATIPLEIGLKDVELNPTLNIDRDTGDIVVTSMVTNRGEEPRSLYAFITAGDLARQQRIIANLQPNQTALKRFRLPGLADQLAGQSIRVGLREMNGPAMVNQLLEVR